MSSYTPHPDYDSLPESIKAVVDPKSYAWMTDEQRADLIARETEPDRDVTE